MKKSIILLVLTILFGLSLLKTASLVAEGQKTPEDLFIPLLFTGVCSFLTWKNFRANSKASSKTDPLPKE